MISYVIKISGIVLSAVLMLCVISINSHAQEDLSIQLDYANNLFENELYFDSITEFKRLLFFDKLHLYDFDANLKIALAYKEGAKYDNAIKFFKEAELAARSEDEKYNIKIQIVRVNILRRTTENALLLLQDLHDNYNYGNKLDDINYWRGWAHLMADDWEKASVSFSHIDPNHPLKILADKVLKDKYSVNFAKVISYILPGAGQFYTGNYLSGLMSLGWNVLWGYLTITSFIEDRAFDGILIGSLLWMRFYRGNVQNAEKFAIEENIKVSNKAYQFLKNNYTGLTP